MYGVFFLIYINGPFEKVFFIVRKKVDMGQKINRFLPYMFWNIPKFRVQNQAHRAESAPSVAIFCLVYDTGNTIQPTVAGCRVGKMAFKAPKMGNISKTAYKKWQKSGPAHFFELSQTTLKSGQKG